MVDFRRLQKTVEIVGRRCVWRAILFTASGLHKSRSRNSHGAMAQSRLVSSNPNVRSAPRSVSFNSLKEMWA